MTLILAWFFKIHCRCTLKIVSYIFDNYRNCKLGYFFLGDVSQPINYLRPGPIAMLHVQVSTTACQFTPTYPAMGLWNTNILCWNGLQTLIQVGSMEGLDIHRFFGSLKN